MKAITIHQPWASLIALGEKRIETRSWWTSHRGPIAIHAGKRIPPEGREWFEDDPEFAGMLGVPDLDALPLGCVVATAKLTSCIEFLPDATQRIWDSGKFPPYETQLGNFGRGRFGWVLADVTPLPEPVPARGMQGLWEWQP